MLSGMYGGPTGSLHLGRLTQPGPEPFLNNRMKRLQRHGINQNLRLPTSRVSGRETGLFGEAGDNLVIKGQEIVEMRLFFIIPKLQQVTFAPTSPTPNRSHTCYLLAYNVAQRKASSPRLTHVTLTVNEGLTATFRPPRMYVYSLPVLAKLF